MVHRRLFCTLPSREIFRLPFDGWASGVTMSTDPGTVPIRMLYDNPVYSVCSSDPGDHESVTVRPSTADSRSEGGVGRPGGSGTG